MNITNTIVTYPDGGPPRYWVGGSGDWNDTAHWSETSGGDGGATVPSYANTAIVDDNSSVVMVYEGITLEEKAPLIITWSDIVYCEFLTTTITTPCIFDAPARINVTDKVSLSDTTLLGDTVYLSSVDTIVSWTLVDGTWTYMDIYYYSETDWNNTTSMDLQNRQVTQYSAWREYCNSPLTTMPEAISTRIDGSI